MPNIAEFTLINILYVSGEPDMAGVNFPACGRQADTTRKC